MTSVAFYIHVPFCRTLCSYCDYPVVIGKRTLSQTFVAAVVGEVQALRQIMQDISLVAVYVGGGTPSFLPATDLKQLLQTLSTILIASSSQRSGIEWTLEANPEDLNLEFLDCCTTAGVNRLSVGAQTFDDNLLKVLSRHCDSGQLISSMRLLNKSWQGRLNVDLLVGIPGQDMKSVSADLDRVNDLGINHVTLLQLDRHEPNGSATNDEADELWLAAADRLVALGYQQYEVTHFGRNGDMSRYLQQSSMLKPVAAVGPGATGTLPGRWLDSLYGELGTSSSSVFRVSHPIGTERYIVSAGNDWGALLEPLSVKDLLIEYLLHGLRFIEGIPVDDRYSMFGSGVIDVIAPLWEQWETTGLARPRGERLALTKSGRLQADRLVLEAASYLDTVELSTDAIIVDKAGF